MNRGLVLGGCGGGLFVEFVGEVGVEAFDEMAVGVHGDDDGAVSESGRSYVRWLYGSPARYPGGRCPFWGAFGAQRLTKS